MSSLLEKLKNHEGIFAQKLTVTTELTQELTAHKAWSTVAGLALSKTKQGRPNTFQRVLALICNACMTHGQTEFLLSEREVNRLIAQDKQINRGPLSGPEYSAIMLLAKKDGFLLQLSAPGSTSVNGKLKRIAGLYRIQLEFVAEYIAETTYEEIVGCLNEEECEEIQAEVVRVEIDEEVPFKAMESSINDTDSNYQSGDEYIPARKFSNSQNEVNQDFTKRTSALPFIGSKTDTFQAFSEALNEIIRDSSKSVFNRWEECCGEVWPNQSTVVEVVNKTLRARFKDPSGLYSLDGEIATRARSIILESLPQCGRTYVQARYCKPSEWKTYRRVDSIFEAKNVMANDFLSALNSISPSGSYEEARVLASEEVSASDLTIYEKVKATQLNSFQFGTLAAG